MQTLERILYAEDEPDIRQVAELALGTVGDYTLKLCNSGLEVLAEIEAFAPQLLLFDVMMPGLDGPSTLTKLREQDAYKTIPVVFMTAKVQPSEVQSLLDMGAAGVIAKPFDPMTLAAQIQALWEKTQG
ncbi:MAG: response regulator [Pseudohongiella sp.]|nr:response regulator [Pseudohongiella sp.]